MNTYNFLSTLLEDAVSEDVFPSAVAAVGMKGHVLHTCAAGNATTDTRFDLASLSKIFSPTMLALMALEEGRLTLYDPLSRFFDAPEDKAGITILQLMTHTGGFTPTFHLADESDSPDEATECILRHPLEAAPDGTPRYSCMGYILLGKILEQTYGKPLDVLAAERVFEPLGMKNTCYNPTGGDFAPTEVSPETGKAWCGVVHDGNARFLRGVSANAGVFSDIMDCCRFVSMLACGGKPLIAPTTLAKAIRNYTPGKDVHRGLGFHLAGSPMNFIGELFPDDAFGHTGFTGTCFAVDPATGFFAILLTNRIHPTRTNEKLFRFRRVFHNAVYAAFQKG